MKNVINEIRHKSPIMLIKRLINTNVIQIACKQTIEVKCTASVQV